MMKKPGLRAWHVPVRLATGAFILNSGIQKLSQADDERRKQIHGLAANAYPAFEKIDPATFVTALGAGEAALGAALLVPFVSSGVAGLGLTAFSGGLAGLYLRTPSMREHGSLRPSPQGLAVSKDVWMLGIGTGLVIDAVVERFRRTGRRIRSGVRSR